MLLDYHQLLKISLLDIFLVHRDTEVFGGKAMAFLGKT